MMESGIEVRERKIFSHMHLVKMKILLKNSKKILKLLNYPPRPIWIGIGWTSDGQS